MQVHDSVVVTRVLAYWRHMVGWVRLQWRALLVKLPVHHQSRAEAAVAWLELGWDRVQHLAGQARGRAVGPVPLQWKSLEVTGSHSPGLGRVCQGLATNGQWSSIRRRV